MHKKTGRFCTSASSDERLVERHLRFVWWGQSLRTLQVRVQVVQQHTFTQPFDALTTLGLVLGRGHKRAAGGEEFFLLKLDALPRRVAQHYRKAPVRGYLRKGQPPMKDAVLAA